MCVCNVWSFSYSHDIIVLFLILFSLRTFFHVLNISLLWIKWCLLFQLIVTRLTNTHGLQNTQSWYFWFKATAFVAINTTTITTMMFTFIQCESMLRWDKKILINQDIDQSIKNIYLIWHPTHWSVPSSLNQWSAIPRPGCSATLQENTRPRASP